MRRLLLATLAAFLGSCSGREDCSCPPVPPLHIVMAPNVAAAVRTVTFEPPGCGVVRSLPMPCASESCVLDVDGRRTGLCTVVLAFDDGTSQRVGTTWDSVSDGGCCGTVLAPRDKTLIVVRTP